MTISRSNSQRRGSVYLAVLGTAMIAGVLAFSALALQRVQNRMLSASSDVHQAQLNAEAAIQMGLLAIKTDPNWRTSNPHGNWFVDRTLGEGTCTLSVTDPLDANLADSATEPILMTGIGTVGQAVQRVVRTVDAYPEALECLRSSIAAGGNIALSGCTLRANNSGLITADTISASGSNVYGRVQATTVSGGTYRDSTTQVAAADRPKMPNWSTVFDYYKNNGTQIPITSVDNSLGNLVRNGNFSTDASNWTGAPPGVPTANVARTTSSYRTGPGGLRVSARTAWNAGASQTIEGYVKAGQSYTITAYVNQGGSLTPVTRNFRIRLTTKGTGSAETNVNSADLPVTGSSLLPFSYTAISATLTAAPWTGDLEYAFIKIAWSDTSSAAPYYDFTIDDVQIQDTSTGRFIFREVLGPGVNTINNSPNPLGLYWIDCQGNRLVIERSRIKGTLVLLNPGAGSMIGSGPISWTPATPGYPILMVDADTVANADFTIAATNRSLSEAEDSMNYNPAGMSHESFGTDSDANDTYPSELQGLILVRDDLTFQNNSLVRGSVIVGDQITATSGSLDVDFRPDALYSPPPGLTDTPKHVTRPLSMRKTVGP